MQPTSFKPNPQRQNKLAPKINSWSLRISSSNPRNPRILTPDLPCDPLLNHWPTQILNNSRNPTHFYFLLLLKQNLVSYNRSTSSISFKLVFQPTLKSNIVNFWKNPWHNKKTYSRRFNLKSVTWKFSNKPQQLKWKSC